MIFLISPAKTLDESPLDIKDYSLPRLLSESNGLVDVLKKKSKRQLKTLMSVSDQIAEVNVERFQSFSTPFLPENAKPAIYSFKGDVYRGLEAETLSEKEIEYAQKHIRILSGLYGILKPLDLMQPYRLEMGTRLKIRRKKNLYEYWDGKITELINQDIEQIKQPVIINLASNEYFKSVKKKDLNGRLISIGFKENRNGVLKMISFNAKRARGLMCRWAAKHNAQKPEDLLEFDYEDYKFNPELSDDNNWLFTR
ncbi:MAG: peroxide stress protein YaaA [Bacteroidota bacterium]